MWREDQLHDCCMYGLSWGLDRKWNCLQILPETLDWRAPHTWHHVLLRHFRSNALLSETISGIFFVKKKSPYKNPSIPYTLEFWNILSFQCNTCGQLVCHPEQPFNFFSDYSQMVSCPQCGTQEYHFAKPLSVYTTKDEANQMQAMQAQQRTAFQHQQQVAAAATAAASRAHRVNSA